MGDGNYAYWFERSIRTIFAGDRFGYAVDTTACVFDAGVVGDTDAGTNVATVPDIDTDAELRTGGRDTGAALCILPDADTA